METYMNDLNLMLDFETLGVDVDSVIVSIGACLFTKDKVTETFYQTVDLDDQIAKGRNVSGNTIKWWLKQGDAAKEPFYVISKPLENVMSQFTRWITYHCIDVNKLKVWGNGFDVAMAENAIKQSGLTVQWNFRNVRCMRTFKEWVANDAGYYKVQGTAHNALDDAINQANYIIKHSKGKL